MVFGLPSGLHIWGRQFELLPGGTMFSAASILTGVIGVEAQPLRDQQYKISQDARVLICGTEQTNTRELEVYKDDIAESYRLRQLQDAQS